MQLCRNFLNAGEYNANTDFSCKCCIVQKKIP